MNCWKCKKEIDPPLSAGRLPFRAVCDHCSAFLHCCVNCQHYRPGLPNNCRIPGTEHIADRQACNFCEEFSLLKTESASFQSLNEVSKKLFKQQEADLPKKNFEDLFHD